MSRRTESWAEERRAVVEAMLAGRLTGREVMDQLGITSSALGGWIRAEQCRKARRPAACGFVAVDLRESSAPARPCAVVELPGGMRVRVEPGFDAGEVVRLLRAAAAAC